jgi:uncharacterized membrane protein
VTATAGRASSGDQQIERAVGLVLRSGVLAAAAIVVVGGAVYLLQYGSDPPEFSVFRAEPITPSSLLTTVRAAASGDGERITQTGVLVLIATPVTRVALSLLGFLRERDYLYVGLTTLVLVAIAASFAWLR